MKLAAAAVALLSVVFVSQPGGDRVTIHVDAGAPIGPMTPMWAWFGYDEPNYTYMKDGRKLLTELAELEPGSRLRPRAQPADHWRWHARAEVGLHQRLYRRRQRPVRSMTGRSSIGS